MKVEIIVFLLFFGRSFGKHRKSVIPNVDHIFKSLSNQQWDADEVSCRDKIFNILENVENSTFWATWVWNSIDQSPTGIFYGARFHLGNYDQCLNPPWLRSHPELRTQYCLAEININKGSVKIMERVTDPFVRAEHYLDTRTPLGRQFSYIGYGVCVPAGCPNKSVAKFVKALLYTGYLHAAKYASIDIHHCEVSGAPHEYTKGFYIYLYTFGALILTAVASTYYVNEYVTTGSSKFNHVAKSFCLRRNWHSVMKEDIDALPCMHGMRFLTSMVIAFMHSVAFVHTTSTSNGLDLEQGMYNKVVLAVLTIHCDLAVDVFFSMSGLLLGKTLTTLNVTKPYLLFKNILKRYIRLVGVLAVVVFYMAHISMHMDDGPLYPKLALFEQQACEKSWWSSLLMVGNYINTLEMCHPASWYVPCDFQLYVITLVLVYLYRKNQRVGKGVTAIVLIIGFLGPAVTTYVYDLSAVLAVSSESIGTIRSNKIFRHRYIKTYNRMGPYVAGLAVGYFMSIYKPKYYRKVWSKTVSFIGACASLSVMLAVLIAGWFCYIHKVDGVVACIFTVFNRTTFAIGALGVIVFCTYGDVPLLNSFLSWPLFRPLSRLSYGVYLIHELILYRSSSSVRTHTKHHMFDILTECLGLTVVSLALSLGAWLLVEAPLINVSNRYLNTKTAMIESQEKSKNEVLQNGSNKAKLN